MNQNKKLMEALKGIGEYIEKMKPPETLEKAKAMLALIGVIANETLAEIQLETGLTI